MDLFKNKNSDNLEQMDNSNYYFLNFFSGKEEIDEKWDDFDFKTTINLESGNIINFRSYSDSVSNDLYRDYGTKKFKIISKEFVIDNNFLKTGGIVCLKVKPHFD